MSKIYNISIDKFVNDCGEEEPNWEKSFSTGWRMCKEEILKKLKENAIITEHEEYIPRYTVDIIEKDY